MNITRAAETIMNAVSAPLMAGAGAAAVVSLSPCRRRENQWHPKGGVAQRRGQELVPHRCFPLETFVTAPSRCT